MKAPWSRCWPSQSSSLANSGWPAETRRSRLGGCGAPAGVGVVSSRVPVRGAAAEQAGEMRCLGVLAVDLFRRPVAGDDVEEIVDHLLIGRQQDAVQFVQTLR